MRKFTFLVFIFCLSFQNVMAWGWAVRDAGRQNNENPNFYLGDQVYFSWDINAVGWGATLKKAGIGTTNTSAGMDWQNIIWVDDAGDGYGQNEGIQSATFTLNSVNTWYYSLWLGWGTSVGDNGRWYNGSSIWNEGSGTFTSSSFTVSALSNPSSTSATQNSSSQIDLSWTKWNSKNVMIVRKKSTESWTEPTQGTAYSVGNNIGSGVVVYNGAGTSYNNNGLVSSTGYDYKFYSVNNNYYSAGEVKSANTASEASDYFRSKADGNWNANGTWESSDNNSDWVNSTLTPTSTAGSVVINHAVTITTDETAGALTINSSKSLTINAGKSLTISGALSNSGTLTIISDPTGTGSLITNGTVSGNVEVQRYLSQNLFHYISSPINYTSGTFSTLSLGLASGDDFRRYETSTNTWIDILNGPDGTFGNPDDLMDDETFVIGKGYAIAYAGENKTLSLTGSPNNGDINVAVTAGGVGNNSGACFVGNPYPSTIKASDFLAANNSTNGSINQTIKGTLYFWDEPGSGGFKKADYATRTSTSGNPGGGNNTPTDYINPGQGFFVSAVTSGNIAFRNAQRAHGSSVFFKEEILLKDFKLQVKNLETTNQNTITIVFDNNSTPGFDELYDAPKWQGNPDLALYSLLGEQKLAIQSLPDTDESSSLKIGLKVSTPGNFVFSVYSIENFDPNTPITLEDKLTGNQVDLTINPEYSFNISEAGTFNDRFVLHFKTGVGINTPVISPQPIFFHQNNRLTIRNLQPGKYQVTVSDIAGRRVAATQVSTDGSVEMPLSLQTGIYIVEISSEISRFANKIFIK